MADDLTRYFLYDANARRYLYEVDLYGDDNNELFTTSSHAFAEKQAKHLIVEYLAYGLHRNITLHTMNPDGTFVSSVRIRIGDVL